MRLDTLTIQICYLTILQVTNLTEVSWGKIQGVGRAVFPFWRFSGKPSVLVFFNFRSPSLSLAHGPCFHFMISIEQRSGYSKFHCGWRNSISRKRFLVNNTNETWDKKIESQKISGQGNCYDTLVQDSIGLSD